MPDDSHQDNGPHAVVLGIDGGNSKTDVVLADATGRVLSHVRGPTSSPDALGVDRAVDVLDALVTQAAQQAGFGCHRPCADVASVYLAGVDLPSEVDVMWDRLSGCRWAAQLVVDNDTFALLRAGTDDLDAVVVVCGAGINCTGVAANGRHVRFAALGQISGDWGGGQQLGSEALWHAARAVDGRGPATVLTAAIAGHFGRSHIEAVIEDIHFGRLDESRLGELSPAVLSAASVAGDAVACSIVERLASEVVILAVTALRRLERLDDPTVVVLGGGVLTSRDALLHFLIAQKLAASAPRAVLTVTQAPPIVGAVLLGFDHLGSTTEVERRIRASVPQALEEAGVRLPGLT